MLLIGVMCWRVPGIAASAPKAIIPIWYKLEIKKAWAININPRFFSQYSGKTMIAGFHTLNIIHAGPNIFHHLPFNTSTKGLPTEPEGGLISRQVAMVAAIS